MNMFEDIQADLVIELDAGTTVAVEAPRHLQKDRGAPRQRFRKTVIRTGEFHKASDGIRFKVTPATLDHWVSQFGAMKSAGVEVPVPDGHGGENLGWMKELFVDGEELVAIVEAIGDDAIRKVQRSRGSLRSPPTFEDHSGNTYTRPITEFAVVDNPAIGGLGEFMPLAASRDRSITMDLKKLAERFGITEKFDEATAVDVFGKRFDAEKQRANDATKKAETLQLSLDQTKAQLDEAKRGKPDVPIDPDVLELSRESRVEALDALVQASRITPAVRDALAKAFVGEPADKTLELSLRAKRVAGTDTFKAVVAALKENDPVELAKERTGPQGDLVLANQRQGGGSSNAVLSDMQKRRQQAGLEAVKL
jgi:hypothetical protein